MKRQDVSNLLVDYASAKRTTNAGAVRFYMSNLFRILTVPFFIDCEIWELVHLLSLAVDLNKRLEMQKRTARIHIVVRTLSMLVQIRYQS
jgi:hypothetical protein